MAEGMITIGVEGEKVQHKIQLKLKEITNNQLCNLITHLGLIRRHLEDLYFKRVNYKITKDKNV